MLFACVTQKQSDQEYLMKLERTLQLQATIPEEGLNSPKESWKPMAKYILQF